MEQEEEIVTPKPWVDIIRCNRLPSNGIEIEYIAPVVIDYEIEVVIED